MNAMTTSTEPTGTGPGPRPHDDLLLAEPAEGADLLAPLRTRLARHGQFGPDQLAGRLFPMACVALEVTQRCNLDCTLCYLSDMAEAVPDVPLDTLLSRVAAIHRHFGPNTNIQITGGDPTLRPVEDLEVIVRQIRRLGMRSALFTNGIRARREMLERLAEAGLNDVCFHVDTTQQRRGFVSEADLHVVRASYIRRAQGLGLRVNFNTTVHSGNAGEVPRLVQWFVSRAAHINLASFQMQADTGRGVLGGRDENKVSQEGLVQAIRAATGNSADFDAFRIGHESCNRHASILVANDRCAALYADPRLFRQMFQLLAGARHDWNRDRDVILAGLGTCLSRPLLLARALRAGLRSLWPLLPAILSGHRPHRLSFFIHNFMAADAIDRARCETCVFQVMTDRGPLSMCAHNADRDAYTMGDMSDAELGRMKGAMALKLLKGRLKARNAEQNAKTEVVQ